MLRTARQAPEEEKGRNPMRNMMVLLAVLSLAATVVAQAPKEQAEAPNLYQVEKIALGTGVESRELVEKPPSLTSLLDAYIAGQESFPRMFPLPSSMSGTLTSSKSPKFP